MSNENTPEMQAAQQELADATLRATQLAQQQAAAGMNLERVGEFDAQQARQDMTQVARRVERAHAEVKRASERVQRELDRQVRAMRDDLERKMAGVNAALEPIEKRIELMREGVQTLDLYLSAAQGVVTIRDSDRPGYHADELEPIVIRQMVLAMDEETGLFADSDGMTVEDVESFDAWLLADPQHVQQVIPERKAVVALVARFTERQHGNPWSKAPEDTVTHFLIRNGDALFRTTVNDFHAGRVLIPRADEFAQFFFHRDYRGGQQPLQPGTREYAKAMERSDKRGRHFLRIGLILQGLVDHSDVFAPLHPAGVNMLTDPSERSEKVRIITDAEGGLESGEATFREWQADVTARLRPGIRIIGAFSGGPWRDANEWDRDTQGHGHSRCFPAGWNWEAPPSGVPLLIEDRRPDGGLVARYHRENTAIFDRSINEPVPDRPGYVYVGKHRAPKVRASVTVYPTDTFILPFDLIESSQQLRGFLASRRNREDYRELWPLIRSAMHAKAQEEQQEAPFALMLAGVLARENGVTVADAQAEAPALIRWFKLKNRWARPLTLETMSGLEATAKAEQDAAADAALNERTRSGRLTSRAVTARRLQAGMSPDVEYDEQAYHAALAQQQTALLCGREHEALAVRMIVAEHARQLADRRRPVNQQVVQRLRARHPDAVLIARPRKGGYLVLTPAHPTDNVWVHELDYTAKGEPRGIAEWRLPSFDRVSRWTVAYQSERWQEWDLRASDRDHLRDPEIQTLAQQMLKLEQVRDRRSEERVEPRPLMVSYQPPSRQHRGRFTLWAITNEGALQDGPAYQAVDREYERKASSVRLRRAGGWYTSDTHAWVTGSEPVLPWEDSSYAAAHVGRVVWGPDPQACARWVELRAAHLRHVSAERDIDRRADELARSVRKQWEAIQTVQLHQRFVAEVPDADWQEWTQHLEGNQPRWEWGHSHHFPYGALGEVLRFLVGKGTDPTGWSTQRALDAARERGLPATWQGFGVVHDFPQAFPAAWAQLVIGAEPVAVPQPPAPDEPDEPAPEGGVEVLEQEEPQAPRDAFDDLRDALRGIGGDA